MFIHFPFRPCSTLFLVANPGLLSPSRLVKLTCLLGEASVIKKSSEVKYFSSFQQNDKQALFMTWIRSSVPLK